MKRTYQFAQPSGHVACALESGESIVLPIFAGILRHATEEELRELLTRPVVARKYTRAALVDAAWPVLREFPRTWLLECLAGLDVPLGRRRALEFMLNAE
ncbi:MAG: hypothetical protein HY791_34905 [Deltaproteobacteria bacterium]|nr:hypothetical protein [Deltaproteobacteria bacterium]